MSGGSASDVDSNTPCRMVRNDAALITAVDDSIVDVLGWRADEMVGRPSTSFIHPEDQPSAIAAWFDMITSPGSSRTWRGRYRASDGGWRWVETVNVNRLDDPANPIVVSSIARVTVDQVSVEEELRARKQLLSRLSDALPVGLFQIDASRHITFTNDRLHGILGVASSATVAAQFRGVLSEDVALLDRAIAAVLADRSVDDLELRFCGTEAAMDGAGMRVCQISLRPLTDDVGNVSGAIGCLTDVTDRVQLRRELEVRATVDQLTGCLNRAATIELLEIAVARAARNVHGIAVIYVDLNRFKTVNDRFGHAAGDVILIEAGRRLRTGVRHQDQVGRLGGDEFLAICPDVSSRADAFDILRRIKRELHGAVTVAGESIELRAALGLAWTDARTSADDLVAQADRAMYEAKARAQAVDPPQPLHAAT